MRLHCAALCAIVSLSLFVASERVSNPFVTAYRQPYDGRQIDRLLVRIEKEGTYEVELEVPHDRYWNVEHPLKPPLVVHAPIGTAFDGMSNSNETVAFRVYDFEAEKGKMVPLTISPGASFDLFRTASPLLVVRRVPLEYAAFFIETVALRALACLFLLVGGFLGITHLVAGRRSA